jgi:hypothetical protein
MKYIITGIFILLLSCSSRQTDKNTVIRLDYFRSNTQGRNSDRSGEFSSLKKCISHRKEMSIDELTREFASLHGNGTYRDFEIVREDFFRVYCLEIKGRKNEG